MKPLYRSAVRFFDPSTRQWRKGSVLMEAVLCLPVLLLLISGIWQFSRLWEARFFTWLAAYNAARATLVYNIRDYAYRIPGGRRQVIDDERHECRIAEEPPKWIFRERSGMAWLAAVNTLAWISQTEGDRDLWYPFPRFDAIPYSTRIKEQVRIVNELDPGRLSAAMRGEFDYRYSVETQGVVRVSVEFKVPLLLSVFDPSLLYPGGATNDTISAFRGVEEDDAKARGRALGRTFALRETVVLPKPYSTEWYPLVPLLERLYLLDAEQATLSLTNGVAGFWSNEGEE